MDNNITPKATTPPNPPPPHRRASSLAGKIAVVLLNIVIWTLLVPGIYWLVNRGSFGSGANGIVPAVETVIILFVLIIVERFIFQSRRSRHTGAIAATDHLFAALIEGLYAFVLTVVSFPAVLVPLFSTNDPDAGYAGFLYLPIVWAVIWVGFYAVRKVTHRNRSLLYFLILISFMGISLIIQYVARGHV